LLLHFRGSISFEVQSYEVQSHLRFGHSRFSPIEVQSNRGSVLFEVWSLRGLVTSRFGHFEVRSLSRFGHFEVRSLRGSVTFELRSLLSFGHFRASVIRGSVFRRSVTVSSYLNKTLEKRQAATCHFSKVLLQSDTCAPRGQKCIFWDIPEGE
jgi:hypothetical protein